MGRTYRRVSVERITKWVKENPQYAAVPLAMVMLIWLVSMGDIQITGISGDMTCGSTDVPCYSEINFTMVKDYIYIYPNESWMFSVDDESNVELLEFQVRDRRYREGWRTVDLTQRSPYCQRTGCKYSYRFYKTKGLWEIRYKLIKKDPYRDMKWSFGPHDPYFFGGKLLVKKTYMEKGLSRFILRFNLTSTINYTINDLENFKSITQKVRGKYGVSGKEFRIKIPAKYVNVTESYACPQPLWYNYTLNPNHFWCWENYSELNNVTNTTENKTRLIFDHDFESYDQQTDTAYWNETEKTDEYYKRFSPLGKTLVENITYELELYLTKEAELGETVIYVDVKVAGNSLNLTFWNVSWDKCRNITIDDNKVSDNLTNFPVYINLTRDSDMEPNYIDLRFVNTSCDNGGSEIPYEIENSTTEKADVWTTPLSISDASNTTISVYYKNSSEVSSGQNVTGTWNSGYVAVWHLNEDPDAGGAGDILDSTANNNDGTAEASMTSADLVAGIVGGSHDYDGTDDYIDCGNQVNLTTTGSLGLWLKTSDTTDWLLLAGKNRGSDQSTGEVDYIMNLDDSDAKIRILISDGSGYDLLLGISDVVDNTWHYTVIDWNATNLSVYVDGNLESVTAKTQTVQANILNVFRIAKYERIFDIFYDGIIDEVRAGTTRTAGWINTSYQNQVSPSTFYTIGDEVTAVVDTCDCPASGDWSVDFADDCVISDACDMQGNNISITNITDDGTFTVNASIFNFAKLNTQGGTSSRIICDAACFEE